MNLIWYSEVKWNYLRTRKHHILSNFSDDDRILFFQPYSFVNNNFFFPRKEKNLFYITLPTFRDTNYYFIKKCLEFEIIRRLFFLLIKIYAKIWEIIIFKGQFTYVCISNIYYLPLIRKCKQPVVWDFNDHPQQFGEIPKWAEKQFDNFLFNKPKKIISSSVGISKFLKDKYNLSTIIIPNGVDLDLFNISLRNNNLQKKSIIGYVGVISPWFFDFELVAKIAFKFQSSEIHLYGPCVNSVKNKLDKLLKLKNVSYFGEKSYFELPQIINNFKVGIIPLISKEEVWRLASGKFLQYLAVGTPVVSVWMEQYSNFNENVFLSKSHKQFLASIKIAEEHNFISIEKELSKYDWNLLSKEFRSEIKDTIESIK